MSSTFSHMRTWGEGVLKGDLVTLRELAPADLPILASWWNITGEAVFQQARFASQPTSAIEQQFQMWSSNDSPTGCGYSITADGCLVGHITLWGMSLPTRIATCAIMIGPDFQNRGYGRDAIRVALRLAFEEMGANKVEIQAWDYNERAVHLYQSLGFIEEGRRRAATFHQGRFHDHVQMGMLAKEYEALRADSRTFN